MSVPRQSRRVGVRVRARVRVGLDALERAEAVEAEAGGATAARAAVEIVTQLQRGEQRLVSKVGQLSSGVCHQ